MRSGGGELEAQLRHARPVDTEARLSVYAAADAALYAAKRGGRDRVCAEAEPVAV